MDHLYDSAGGLVAVCAFLIPVCTIFVFLRLWIRWQKGNLGLDDCLFLLGLVLWIISTSFLFPGCWNGIGAHKGRYTDEQAIEAAKYFFLFQDFYVWANIPIKSSICLSLIRVAESTSRWMTWTLYSMIFLIAGSSVGANIYLLTSCTPLAASWDKTIQGATCRPPSHTVILGNMYSGINIFVDWVVALLPILLLWRIQMPLRQKVTVMAVLSLGIFASTATLVRLTTLANLANADDYLFGLASVSVWSVTELALALFAGALMSLKPLFRRWFGSESRSMAPDYGRRTPGTNDVFHQTRSQASHIKLDTFSYGGASRQPIDNESQKSIMERGGCRSRADTIDILAGDNRSC
ncbi:hypothetical protein F4778DRAFT_28646 [Xylariomycetidae sp. FL2044]|nr:hypothetical protein F4778DRAFT_28646 [Xylariomycetidae sp. FL2044]